MGLFLDLILIMLMDLIVGYMRYVRDFVNSEKT